MAQPEQPITGPGLTRIGSNPRPGSLQALAQGPQRIPCPKCSRPTLVGAVSPSPGDPDGPAVCWDCRDRAVVELERQKEAAAVLTDLEGYARTQLELAGAAPREIRATRDKVPEALKRAIPPEPLKAVLAGEVPARGFGIGGRVQGGKTSCLVAILKVGAQAFARREVPQKGARAAYSRGLAFVNWPDEVNAIRRAATDPATAERLERLAAVPILVLDDLGRERIRGSYTEDWAASQLDGIISARYRHERPTLWTTNVPMAELVALYGAALMARLTADNPLTWVDGLTDMRGV